MNLKQTALWFGLLTGGWLATTAPNAIAASFTAADAEFCVGQNTCLVNDFFTLTAQPNNKEITTKTIGGVQGLGVADDAQNLGRDPSRGEIDIGEILRVDFARSSVLEFLDLSFMYQPGVYEDEVFEIAQVTSDAGVGTLTITGDTSAVWSLGGSVVNLSPSLVGRGGSYRILNPFSDSSISGFSLTPVLNTDADGNIPTGFENSDFALSAVGTIEAEVKIPESSSTGALLGLGALFGLSWYRRRWSAKNA